MNYTQKPAPQTPEAKAIASVKLHCLKRLAFLAKQFGPVHLIESPMEKAAVAMVVCELEEIQALIKGKKKA